MKNIVVWTAQRVEIEGKTYDIVTQDDMVNFLQELMNTVHYTGESTCLESASIDIEKGRALYREIERWKSVPTP